VNSEECSRADRLVRALDASLAGNTAALGELFTDDVHGSSPTLAVSSLAELTVEVGDRASTFTEVTIVAEAACAADRGYAEWMVTGRHTGPLVVDESIVIPPGGRDVTLRGVTVAEFRGDKISAFRQYWDEIGFLESLGLIPPD
jgi:hypothetical protein